MGMKLKIPLQMVIAAYIIWCVPTEGWWNLGVSCTLFVLFYHVWFGRTDAADSAASEWFDDDDDGRGRD